MSILTKIFGDLNAREVEKIRQEIVEPINALEEEWQKLSDEQLEAMGVVDILILPIGGGGYTLDAVDAAKVIRIIEPKIVIPTHYADKSLQYEVPQDELQLFIDELGAPVETVPKYKVKQNFQAKITKVGPR